MPRGMSVVRYARKHSFSTAWDVICYVAKFSLVTFVKRAKSAAQDRLNTVRALRQECLRSKSFLLFVTVRGCFDCNTVDPQFVYGLAGSCQTSLLKHRVSCSLHGRYYVLAFCLPVDLPRTRWIADLDRTILFQHRTASDRGTKGIELRV